MEAIEERHFSELFEQGLQENRYTSRTDLDKRARVSEGFIKELNKNSGDLKTIQSLVALARDLNLSIADVCPAADLKGFAA